MKYRIQQCEKSARGRLEGFEFDAESDEAAISEAEVHVGRWLGLYACESELLRDGARVKWWESMRESDVAARAALATA